MGSTGTGDHGEEIVKALVEESADWERVVIVVVDGGWHIEWCGQAATVSDMLHRPNLASDYF